MSLRTRIMVFFSATVLTVAVAGSSSGTGWDGAWRHHERQAPTSEIVSLFALPDGRVAAGCAKSLHVYENGRWSKTVYDTPVLANHAPFFTDSGGKLYFLDNNRLVIWDRGKVTRHEPVELYEPLSAAETRDGTVLFGSYSYSGSGVFIFDGNALTRIHDGRVRSLAIDTSGNVWATLIPLDETSLRLMCRAGETWFDRTGEIEQILPVIGNNLMVQAAPDSSVWVTNEGSYGVRRNGAWTFARNSGGVGPISLAFDRSGRVWGYSIRTLYLLDENGKWTVSWTYRASLPNGPGFIAVGPDSALYTFDTDTVYRWSGGTWGPLENRLDLGSDIVSCMAFLKDGRLICGHGIRGVPYESREHRGVSIFDGAVWTNLNHIGSSWFRNVYNMKRSPEDDIVIYADDGYYLYDGKTFYTLDSLKVFDTTDMAWDSSGKMWITTNLGLVQYRNPDFDIYPPPQMYDPWGGLYNLCIDDNDFLYMQAIHGHILYTDREDWYLLVADTGREINDIAVEGNGTLWAARITDLSYWNSLDDVWQPVADFPDSNRLVHIDAQGRVWASGYGKTGYFENQEFYSFPELSKTGSDFIAFSDDGRIALNAFDRDRKIYLGMYEYLPRPSGVNESPRPGSFINADVYPNPFNLTATIRFELPIDGTVRIEVYNVSGQRVRKLVDRAFKAGTHSIVWDSRSDGGGVVSSGVYFYRIVEGKICGIGKMLLLK